MTSNAKKDQQNTSDPPPKYLMKYMTPPAPRSFYFHPPPSTSPKQFPTPPEYNRPPPAGNKWLVPYDKICLCHMRTTKTQISLISVGVIRSLDGMSRLMTQPAERPVGPAKTQISLGIRPVWSQSSQCAHWVTDVPRFLLADSEDSDQTGKMCDVAQSIYSPIVVTTVKEK